MIDVYFTLKTAEILIATAAGAAFLLFWVILRIKDAVDYRKRLKRFNKRLKQIQSESNRD